MSPFRIPAVLGVGALVAGLAVPSVVDAQEDQPGIVDLVLEISGTEGFDSDGADYDLLREALLATELAGAVAGADDITVFAPTDAAFIRLATDLGYDGNDEAGAFGFIAELTGFTSAAEPGLLDDVLLYHVAPGAKTVHELRRSNPTATLLDGATLRVYGNRVVDADRNDRDARIRRPKNVEAANGIVHTVNRVLRPIDLEAPLPASAVDVVISTSGAEGFDRNGRDYDLLREALVATDLVAAVAAAEDITVFAPNDRAFIRLAHDLGYNGYDEEGAFGFIAAATGFVSAEDPGILADVLLYHVSPGAKDLRSLLFAGEIETLLEGSTLNARWFRIVDGDPDDRDAWLTFPLNIENENGIVHTVTEVLRPIDL